MANGGRLHAAAERQAVSSLVDFHLPGRAPFGQVFLSRFAGSNKPLLILTLGAITLLTLVSLMLAIMLVPGWAGEILPVAFVVLGSVTAYTVLRMAGTGELTIKAQRQLVEAGFEAADAIVILRSAEGRLMQANAVAERVSGYSDAELARPEIWQSTFLPGELGAERAVEAEALRGDRPVFREGSWVAKCGKRHLIRWSNVRLQLRPGGAPVLLKVGLDLTELRRSEFDLLRNETYLRLAHRMAKLCHWYWRPDGIEWHLNPTNSHGHYTYSDEVEDLFGYPPESLPNQGDPFAKMIAHPEDEEMLRSHYKRFREGGDDTYSIEYRAIHRTGRLLYVRETGERRRDEAGDIIQIAGTFQDVTELRASERSLQRAEAELRRSLRMSGLCHWSWQLSLDSPDGMPGIYQSSGDTADLLGLAPEDVALNDHDWHRQVVHPDDADWSWQRYEEFRWGPAATLTQEYRIDSRYRGLRYVRSICEKTFDAEGRLIEISGALQDITEQRQREHELLRAKNAAEIANRSKTEFLANMSHELRTPLNAVIGFSQVIRDQYFGDAPDRYATYAADIYKSGQWLLKQISDVLDMSKLEAGKEELTEEPVDILVVAEECVKMLRAKAEEGQVRIECNWATDLPLLTADAHKVSQIVLNVLTNAIKFSPPDRVVFLSSRLDDGGDLLIVIRDTGIGMSKEAMQHLFSAFHQADATISRRFGGTGLGLAITKRLMELHGGSIDLSSEVGQGTRVVLRFPSSRVARRETARTA
ncbi:MAG: PAS domain-containing protein [Rhodospirillaceae bacterium]|nr:PAS domain-containing protein [Rhodospirillaceae bacterium]